MERTHFDSDHDLFREGFRQFVATEMKEIIGRKLGL